jgi:ribosomal silencing factor RsfS
MGGSIGMMIASCQTSFHIQTVTKALIDHLKARKLQDLGVLGAQMGSNRFSPRNSSSNWNVVDCSTYLVHIMDTPTREALQLEDLWSGKDPIWKLDIRNEEAVDEYVSRHPVPRNYGYQQPATLWDIGKLERNQFVPHSPVVSGAQKQQDRRAGRRKRREMRQGY